MKIDVLKNIKSFMYVDGSDPLNLPYWYPAECSYDEATYLEYLKDPDSVNKYVYDIKPVVNFSYDPLATPDVSLYIGFANSQIIDNIELDVSGTFTTIELKYSMDDWTYHYENYTTNPFDGLTNLYPTNPIYLNRALTAFNKSIECKILKITFKSCSSIVLNDIIIEKDEVINIPSDTLNEFVYTSFQNDILSIYKDTDIKDCIIKYQDMMIEENE
jgi:hypothetical protein